MYIVLYIKNVDLIRRDIIHKDFHNKEQPLKNVLIFK